MSFNISSHEGAIPFSLGWLADPPSNADYCPESPNIEEILQESYKGMLGELSVPAAKTKADISKYNSLVKDQTDIGACVGKGTTGNMEHHIKKNYNIDVVLSGRYSYKTTRFSMGSIYDWNDSGAFIRNGFGAAVTHGCPPEQYWPWISKGNTIRNEWNDVPHPLVIPYAMNYRIEQYMRLDPADYRPQETLTKIKNAIGVDETPVTFGFTCFSSLFREETTRSGRIPMRQSGDQIVGGHAVLACGFDDDMIIAGQRGALLIKNSWGLNWGVKGYGWLPYAYILQGAASDFWTILKMNVFNPNLKPFQI